MKFLPSWHKTAFPRPVYKWLIAFGWIAFVACLFIISSASLMKVAAPPSGSNIDKVLHILAYGALTTGMVFALPKRSLTIIFVTTFIFGLIIEFLQGAIGEGRTASLADAAANGLGALIIIGLWIWICPRLKHNPA